MCMNCKMYINFFIFLYLEKTTYFLIFYHSAYSARTAHPFRRNGAPFRFKLSKAQQVD